MTQEILTKLVVDCTTGEEVVIPLTEEELLDREQIAASLISAQQEQEEATAAREALKASAKAKLVAGQPLTEEEAGVLVL
jgi:hypothetical protein